MDVIYPKIFLSYSWSDKVVADELDYNFRKIGLTLIRDTRDAKYSLSIKQFMQKISASDYVIMLISDQFLRSANCMYEVIELLNSNEFEKRVLPIIVDNTSHIFRLEDRKKYYDYWKGELVNKESLLVDHINEDFLEEKKKIENINKNLGSFFKRLTELKTKTFEEIKQGQFMSVFEIAGIEKDHLLYELYRIDAIKNLEKQEAELDRFLRKYPEFPNVWFYKAFLVSSKGMKERALAYYRKVLELDDNFDLAHNNIAVVLIEYKDDIVSAKYHFEKAIQINPYATNAIEGLSDLLELKFEDYLSCLQLWEKVLPFVEPSSGIYSKIGRFAFKLRRFEESETYLNQALEMDSQNVEAHINLAIVIERKMTDFDSVLSHLNIALTLDPNNAYACQCVALFTLRNVSRSELPEFLPMIRHWYRKSVELDKSLTEPMMELLFKMDI